MSGLKPLITPVILLQQSILPYSLTAQKLCLRALNVSLVLPVGSRKCPQSRCAPIPLDSLSLHNGSENSPPQNSKHQNSEMNQVPHSGSTYLIATAQ
jgi:hypothetical protein